MHRNADGAIGLAAEPLVDAEGTWTAGRKLGLTVLLILFASFTCLAFLGSGPPMGDHECIAAQSGRQAIQSGEWLIPRVGEIQRIRKTPLGIWLIAGVSKLLQPEGALPVTQMTARLPSAVAAVGTVLVALWLGTMMFGFRPGIIAGFIGASSVGTILYGRNAQVDMVLALFTALSFAFFWYATVPERPAGRRWVMIGFYVAFALAMMAKAPLPLVTVGFALAVYWFVTLPILGEVCPIAASPVAFPIAEADLPAAPAAAPARRDLALTVKRIASRSFEQFKRLPVLWLIPGVIVWLVLSFAWPAYAMTHVPNALKLWKVEYLDRFTGDLSERRYPAFYYVPLVFGLCIPFFLSVPEALAAAFLKKYRAQRRGLAFAFTWAIVGTVFLSTASYKRPHYLLSVMPAFWLLLAPVIDNLFFGPKRNPRLVKLTCTLLPILVVAGLIAGAHYVRIDYPGLMRNYGRGGVLFALLVTGACISYAAHRRAASFAQLVLCSVVAVALFWPALGREKSFNAESRALARELKGHGITAADELYWVGGRPDSSFEFYSGLRLRRLVNELEMVDLRKTRSSFTQTLVEEFGRRVRDKLGQPRPVYLILNSTHYNYLSHEASIPAGLFFEMDRPNRPGEKLLVITQKWNQTSQPSVSG